VNIIATDFTLEHGAVEVYLAGCNRRCPGCHNPETWDFNQGNDWRYQVTDRNLMQRLKTPLTDKIWIMGGEPLDQDLKELTALLDFCSEAKRPIWLWTSYELDDVPDSILVRVNVIKTGRYIQDLPGYKDEKTGIFLASLNQRLTSLRITLHF
jgi:anaerobic ribonucleoside-triphosphate reductase activating protein